MSATGSQRTRCWERVPLWARGPSEQGARRLGRAQGGDRPGADRVERQLRQSGSICLDSAEPRRHSFHTLYAERGGVMPAGIGRRDFLKRAGLLAVAVPGVATVLDACASVVPTAKAKILRVGWTIEPDTMNPLTTYSTEAVEVLQLIYDQLMHYDLDLKPAAALATSWRDSPDGKSITYTLRSATWHDGKAFTSADAKFTFDLIKSTKASQYYQWVTSMVSTEAPNATTLALHFSQPQAFNPGLAVPIIPQHIWTGMDATKIP